MNNNSKCFIKQKGKTYKEITYGELKERRKYKTYKNKKFIKVEDMLFEVSKEEFDDYHREDERIWIYVKFLDTFFENFFIFMRPLSSLYYILNLYWYK